MTEPYEFKGYSELAYTPIPDEFFDWQMHKLTGSELKVLLYIFRRTFGFKKYQDHIALSQFTNGICKRTGERLDEGCGLSTGSVSTAICSLAEQGYIDYQFYCGKCKRMVEPDELTQEIRKPSNRKPYTVSVVPLLCPGCLEALFGNEERWISLVMKERFSPLKPPFQPTKTPVSAHESGGFSPLKHKKQLQDTVQETVTKEDISETITENTKRRKPTPPAVRVFRENAHRYPAKAWYNKIATVIGEEETNLERWGKLVLDWVGYGWNPTNVKGMLEAFKNGGIKQQRGKSAAPTEPAAFAGLREWLTEEVGEARMQEIYRGEGEGKG